MRLRARKDVSARQKFSAHQVGRRDDALRVGERDADAKQGARCKIAFEDRIARVCAKITLLSNDTPQFRCRLPPGKTVK